MKQVIECLKSRKAWYEKAIAMDEGKIPYENHFDRPPCTNESDATRLYEWRGAVWELKNTINMLAVNH